MGSSERKIRLFYSYAHEDKLLRDELAKHLGSVHISGWHDGDIDAGDPWEYEINRNLEAADIILLLISVDFMVSNNCDTEMRRALEKERTKEKNVRVIPIILRPVASLYYASFRHLKRLPSSEKSVTMASNKDKVLAEIADEVHRVVDGLLKDYFIQDAKEALINNQYEEACKACKRALYYDPNNSGLHKIVGDLLSTLDRYEEALAEYEKSIELQPEDAQAYRKKGKALSRLGRHQEARAVYRQGENLSGNDSTFSGERENDSTFNEDLGDISYALGDFNEAVEKYQAAIRLQSTNYRLHISLGNVLYDLNKYHDALEAYNMADDLKKNDPQIVAKKGKILLKINNYPEALKVYNRAICLSPDKIELYRDKGYILDELERYNEALKVYEEVIHLDNKNAEVWRDKGDILVKMGQFQEALGAYEEAIRLEPEKAHFYKDRADTLSKLDRYEDALVAFDEAIVLEPSIDSWYAERAKIKREIAKIKREIAKTLQKRYEELLEDAERDDARAEGRKVAKDTKRLK